LSSSWFEISNRLEHSLPLRQGLPGAQHRAGGQLPCNNIGRDIYN
jgi:hypothetical protein